MKISALLAALAIASGSAMAAGNSDDTGRHSAAVDTQRSTAADQTQRTGPSFVEKTKRAFRRMGDKISKATHTDKGQDRNESAARNNETRAMGAAGSDSHDSGRRGRMDDAYSNSQKKGDQQTR